jgi:transcription initiation factor TFIID subunit 12
MNGQPAGNPTGQTQSQPQLQPQAQNATQNQNQNQNQNQSQQQQPLAQYNQPPPQMMNFRPEQMRSLPPSFSDEDKTKWEQGLTKLYAQLNSAEPNSQAQQEAQSKIKAFSATLHRKILSMANPSAQRQQQQQQQPAAAMNSNISQNQEAQAQQVRQAQQAHQQAQHQAQQQAQQQAMQQGQAMRPQTVPQARPAFGKLSDHARKHVEEFKFILPGNFSSDAPEAKKSIGEMRQKYAQALAMVESYTGHMKQLEYQKAQRSQQGGTLTADDLRQYEANKIVLNKKMHEAKTIVNQIRLQNAAANPGLNGQTNGQNMPQQQQPSMRPGMQQQSSARPVMSTQQINAANTAQQSGPAMNAAFQAAQAASNQRPQMNPQTQSGIANGNAPNNSMMQSMQQQNRGGPQMIKPEPGAMNAPGNAVMAGAPHMQPRPHQNSPQSAHAQTVNDEEVRPLTHSAALQRANRSYSNGQTTNTPQVMQQAHQQSREPSNNNMNTMPISKNLPPSVMAIPQPVNMQPARPTLSGGPNGANHGMMGQPVIAKGPQFDFQGEGERVLSKKKLDELVRQVTGGGEGHESGEGLTPEVEDVSYSLPTSTYLHLHHTPSHTNTSPGSSQRRRRIR